MKNLLISLRITAFFTVLLGFLYPLLITAFAQTFFASKADGQFVEHDGKLIGSMLIAQKFEKPEYFWPRPSAVDYNPLPSGGSNLGPTSGALKEAMAARAKKWQETNADVAVPAEMTFASGSGLDPHISPEAALAQVPRIAKARHIAESDVQNLVKEHTHGRDLGLLGESNVNVLALNLALDKLSQSH